MAEPTQRRTDIDGSKFYEHPTRVVTGPDGEIMPARYESVTWVLSALNKDSLKFWSAKLAAQRAVDNLPKLLLSLRTDPCGRAYCRTEPLPCNECPECMQRWLANYHLGESSRRRREGSATADVLEHWILRGEWPDLEMITARHNQDETQERIEAATLEPYVLHLQQWVTDFGLTPLHFVAAEMTVFNHLHRYAGTLDGIVRIEPTTAKAAKLCARVHPEEPTRPVVALFDTKSREGEGKRLYDDHPLQLAPYRYAETALIKSSGIEVTMPRTDVACVLQVRPDGYTFEPVLTEMPELTAFLGLLTVARWRQQRGAAAIAVRTFPVPDGWSWGGQESTKTRTGGASAAPDPTQSDSSGVAASNAPTARHEGATTPGEVPEGGAGVEAEAHSPTAQPSDGVTDPGGGAKDASNTPTPAAPPPAKRTRKPAKKAQPAVPERIAGATLESLRDTGGKQRAWGRTLADDDIPF